MRVTFIGSGDAFGSGGRLQACILLEDEGQRTLLDCGATSLVGLKRTGIDPNSIEAVVVSHLHGDHFGGLPFMIIEGQLRHRESDLHVFGPQGAAERLRQTMEALYPNSSTVRRRFEIRVHELEAGVSVDANGLRVTPFLADHASGAPAHIYRVEGGGWTIAYTGDTAWTDAVIEASAGANLLIAEALFRDKEVRYHLNVATLNANRDRLSARRIILTHMDSDVLDNPPTNWECAYDGLVVEV